MFRNTQGGVTLIELITVVVIVAILTAVAIPGYRSYLIRAQRTEAKTALLNLRAAQEKFYLQNNQYTDAVATAPPVGLGLLGTSDTGLYDIDVQLTSVAAQAYTATATPVATRGQGDDAKCTTFTLNDVGVRGNTGTGDTEYCWR